MAESSGDSIPIAAVVGGVFDGYVRHAEPDSISDSIQAAKMLGRMRMPKRKKKKPR